MPADRLHADAGDQPADGTSILAVSAVPPRVPDTEGREMSLPVRPESEEALRARYAAALTSVYDVDYVAQGKTPRPGSQPAHVFDTRDGVRLIISRERWPDGVKLHVSASFHDDCSAELKKIRQVLPIELAVEFLLRRFREISGERGAARFVGLSEGKGVPHWVIEPEPDHEPC